VGLECGGAAAWPGCREDHRALEADGAGPLPLLAWKEADVAWTTESSSLVSMTHTYKCTVSVNK